MKDDIEDDKNSSEDNTTDIKENQAQIHRINTNLGLSNLMMKEIEDLVEKVTQNTEQIGEHIKKLYTKIKIKENKANENKHEETHEPSWIEIAAKLLTNNTILSKKSLVPLYI